MEIIENNIPIEIYRELRVKSGLSGKDIEAATIGLQNSVYSVMIKKEKTIVGMGRIIGDGGCFCQVVDICVLPECQGQGVGKIIMEQISNFIQTQLPKSCYVSLLADGNANHLYEKFGFKDTLPHSRGMALKVV
jgi:ribosomal protein S18 acetylase RimI-like enzyme